MKTGSTSLANCKFGSTQIQKIMQGVNTIWENWVKKSGTYFTTTLEFAMNGTSTLTSTSSTFTAVKPTKLMFNWAIHGRDWVVTHSITIQGLTESGTWVNIWYGERDIDGGGEDCWYVYNDVVSVSVSEPIKQLRSITSGRYWAHTQTIKITEWYQKGN